MYVHTIGTDDMKNWLFQPHYSVITIKSHYKINFIIIIVNALLEYFFFENHSCPDFNRFLAMLSQSWQYRCRLEYIICFLIYLFLFPAILFYFTYYSHFHSFFILIYFPPRSTIKLLIYIIHTQLQCIH